MQGKPFKKEACLIQWFLILLSALFFSILVNMIGLYIKATYSSSIKTRRCIGSNSPNINKIS